MSTTAAPDDWADLLAAARRLAARPRRLLGITGAPGAGKSVLAQQLVEALDGRAVLVGMDGFHLLDDDLRRLGRYERKGAPDTFDAAGYVALLRRLRAGTEAVVRAPRFDRGLEAPVAGAVAVPREVPLVITEGNYLLLDEGAWSGVAPLLDECWYVEVDERERQARLSARHRAYGRSPDEAAARTLGPDLANARLVATTRPRATRIVVPPPRTVDART